MKRGGGKGGGGGGRGGMHGDMCWFHPPVLQVGRAALCSAEMRPRAEGRGPGTALSADVFCFLAPRAERLTFLAQQLLQRKVTGGQIYSVFYAPTGTARTQADTHTDTHRHTGRRTQTHTERHTHKHRHT